MYTRFVYPFICFCLSGFISFRFVLVVHLFIIYYVLCICLCSLTSTSILFYVSVLMVQWFSGLVIRWFNGRWIIYVEGRGMSGECRTYRGGGAVVGLVGWSDVRVFGCSRAWFGLVLLPWVIYIYIFYIFIFCVWGLGVGKSIRVFEYLVVSI